MSRFAVFDFVLYIFEILSEFLEMGLKIETSLHFRFSCGFIAIQCFGILDVVAWSRYRRNDSRRGLLLLVFGDGGVGGGFDTFLYSWVLSMPSSWMLSIHSSWVLSMTSWVLSMPSEKDTLSCVYICRVFEHRVFENEYYISTD